MSKVLSITSIEGKGAIDELFAKAPPILVEIRYPKQGTSPDWQLCDEESDLDLLTERLGPGVEVYLNSVWDMTNRKEAICLRR